MVIETERIIHLRPPHPRQAEFIDSVAKRIIVRAGRRAGKTLGVAIKALIAFLDGRRVLYAAPTSEQTDRFWYEISIALAEVIDAGIYVRNKSERFIEKPGTLNRIKAKTAWNADTLRGDYADLLILDEFQLANEDTWEVVGAPMLIDNNGDAIFIYTPPSLRSAGLSKAHDPRHAATMFKTAGEDKTGRWARFHFTSFDNPFLAKEGLSEVTKDMSRTSYRQEILAEDDELLPSHLVYGVWNETLCKIPRFEIPFNWPVYSGHDFGLANPACLFWARVRLPIPPGAPVYLRMNDLVAFREYLPGKAQSAAINVQAFQDITKGRTVSRSAGGSHQEDGSRGDYTKSGWPIIEPPIGSEGGPSRKRQIDRVLATMELNKWYVFDDLIFYLAELASCAWKYDKDGQKTNDIDGEARFHLCFVAGTMVQTINGKKPIELIRPGDLVATRQGYHTVKDCGITQIADTVEVYFSNGTWLRGTKDHPVWVKGKGFIPLATVRYNDTMESWKEKPLFTEEQSTIVTQKPRREVTVSTSSQRRVISTVLCGKMLTEQFLRGALSIIKMVTLRIMNYLTLNVRAMANIWQTICEDTDILSVFTQNRQRQIVVPFGVPPQEGNFAQRICAKRRRAGCHRKENVLIAGSLIRINPQRLVSSVLISASQPTVARQGQITNPESALCAENSLLLINTKVTEPAPVYVVKLVESDKAQVYNLTVDTVHEYYANGILVSNCACARYGLSLNDFVPETVLVGAADRILVVGW